MEWNGTAQRGREAEEKEEKKSEISMVGQNRGHPLTSFTESDKLSVAHYVVQALVLRSSCDVTPIPQRCVCLCVCENKSRAEKREEQRNQK